MQARVAAASQLNALKRITEGYITVLTALSLSYILRLPCNSNFAPKLLLTKPSMNRRREGIFLPHHSFPSSSQTVNQNGEASRSGR